MRILIFLLVIFLSLVSCIQGTTNNSNLSKNKKDSFKIVAVQEKLKETNNDESFFSNEQNIDTIINCKNIMYRIYIKKMQIKGKIYNGELDNKIRVVIITNSDTIYNKVYDKTYFKITDKEFLSKATLYNISFDGADCEKEKLKFFCSVVVPETDWAYIFEFYVSKYGKHKFYEIDEEGNEKYRPEIE